MRVEPAAGASGIVRDEVVDDEATVGEIGDAVSDAEMDTAHGVGIGQRGAREGACPKHEFDAIATEVHDRVEAVARHGVRDLRDGVVDPGATARAAPYAAPPDLDRSVAGASHVSEQETQPFVGSGDAPPTVDRGCDAIDEAGAASAAGRGRGLFVDELGLDEFGKVLTYRVVVEPEVRGELSDVDWFVGVRDVAEDVVPGRIAERARLFLQ